MGCCYGRKEPYYPCAKTIFKHSGADTASKNEYITYSRPVSEIGLTRRNGLRSDIDWDEVYDDLSRDRESEDSEDSFITTASAPAAL